MLTGGGARGARGRQQRVTRERCGRAAAVEGGGEEQHGVGARASVARRAAGAARRGQRAFDPARGAADRRRAFVGVAGELEPGAKRRQVGFERSGRVGVLAHGLLAVAVGAQSAQVQFGLLQRPRERLLGASERRREHARQGARRRERRGARVQRRTEGGGERRVGARADGVARGRQARFGQAGDGDAAVEEAPVASRSQLGDAGEERPEDGDGDEHEQQLDQARQVTRRAQARHGGRARGNRGGHGRQGSGARNDARESSLQNVPGPVPPARGSRRISAPAAKAGGCS